MFSDHPGLTYPHPLLYIDCFLPIDTQWYLFVRLMDQHWSYMLFEPHEELGDLPTEKSHPDDDRKGYAGFIKEFHTRMTRIGSIRSQSMRAALMALPNAPLGEFCPAGQRLDHFEMDFLW